MFKIGIDRASLPDTAYDVIGRLFVHNCAKLEPDGSELTAIVFPGHRSDGKDVSEEDAPPLVLDLIEDAAYFQDCPLYMEVPSSTLSEYGVLSIDGLSRLIRIGSLPDPRIVCDHKEDAVFYSGREGAIELAERFRQQEVSDVNG